MAGQGLCVMHIVTPLLRSFPPEKLSLSLSVVKEKISGELCAAQFSLADEKHTLCHIFPGLVHF